MNAVGPAQLLVTDSATGTVFLVDSGAQVSLVPRGSILAARMSPSPAPRPQLFAANGSPITTAGALAATIHIAGKRYKADFIVADVRRAILGADFLRNHGLLIDIRGQRLLDASTLDSVPCAVSAVEPGYMSPVLAAQDEFARLLADHPSVLTPIFNAEAPAHGVYRL